MIERQLADVFEWPRLDAEAALAREDLDDFVADAGGRPQPSDDLQGPIGRLRDMNRGLRSAAVVAIDGRRDANRPRRLRHAFASHQRLQLLRACVAMPHCCRRR